MDGEAAVECFLRVNIPRVWLVIQVALCNTYTLYIPACICTDGNDKLSLSWADTLTEPKTWTSVPPQQYMAIYKADPVFLWGFIHGGDLSVITTYNSVMK